MDHTEEALTETVLADLKQLAADIIEHDKNGLRRRWEFGHKVQPLRGGRRKLPKGVLAQLAQHTGLSGREIQNCLKFAERYPTEKAFCDASQNFPTWFELVHDGLFATKEPNPETTAEPEGDPPGDDDTSDEETGTATADSNAEWLLERLAELDVLALTDPGAFVTRERELVTRHEQAALLAAGSR